MTGHNALLHILERISSFDAVVWDFDGVLSETEALHQESYRQVAASHQFTPGGDWYTALIGNTAFDNWRILIDSGLPAEASHISALEAEREHAFARLVGAGLSLSKIGEILVPAFAASGTKQEVVSNGDLSLIHTSIRQWGLDEVLHIVQRRPAADKHELIKARARPGVVTFDDTDRYLRAAEEAGALAVGVRHRHNSHCKLSNLILHIDAPGAP
ncbi:hypothetical protein Q9R30_15245 [Arthrobacter sp. AB6]|uniref:hypothetical protein n=1 Tax=Arthrobacter sp. AB6 TaxID=2962570 RepID=UPI0028818482|nr:hypothetical protein [Arthrobacter sp. AB6]MDT0196711.1 hypothetical protein [Arthrobacter sp. AB6]